MFDYYKIIVGYALVALDSGDVARATEILHTALRGDALPDDPQRRSLAYCEYRQGWPLTETGARE